MKLKHVRLGSPVTFDTRTQAFFDSGNKDHHEYNLTMDEASGRVTVRCPRDTIIIFPTNIAFVRPDEQTAQKK